MTRTEDPHSIPDEEALLGAVLAAPKHFPAKLPVDPAEFYRPSHGLIWDAILACLPRVDVVTVGAELDRRGQLTEIAGEGTAKKAGRDRLAALAASVAVPGNAPAYAQRVKELAALRGLRRQASRLQDAIEREDHAEAALAIEALGNPIRYLDVASGEIIENCPTCEANLAIIEEKERRISGLELQVNRQRKDKKAEAKKETFDVKVGGVKATIHLWDEAAALFDWWRIACDHPAVSFDYEEFELVAAHLRHNKKSGHYDCLEAIAGAAYEPMVKELRNGRRQRFDDWELIFRNRGKLRSFRDRAPRPPKAKNWQSWLIERIEGRLIEP